MSREEILKKVNEVFVDVLDDKSLVVSDSTNAADIENWDSLMHITLISSIEEEFNMKFEMAEVVGFNNVGDMVDAICKKVCK